MQNACLPEVGLPAGGMACLPEVWLTCSDESDTAIGGVRPEAVMHDDEFGIMDYGLWIMDYGLWIMDYGLWITL